VSETVQETAPAETKKCIACGNEILRDTTPCPICKSDPIGEECNNCKKRMPKGAPFCTECKLYQSKRKHLPTIATWFTLLLASFAVVSGVLSAWTYLAERDSHTRFKVTSADELHIYLKVWNTGRQPSMLVAYHLRFEGNLPIKDVMLQLSKDDVVAARNVIPAGQPVKIGLTMTGPSSLEIASTADKSQNTKDKLSKILGSQTVVLDVDVEESDDPRPGGFCNCIKPRTFHTQSDTFPVDRIKTFVVSRMSEGHNAESPLTSP
jgi:hypothetical protein